MWIKASGKIQVSNGVRIVTNSGICGYYQWLIKRQKPWIKTQLPTHGGHITICNPKIHKVKDFSLARYLHGKKVDFEFNPEEIYESKVNFWMPARTTIYQEVKSLFQFTETEKWWGLHLTICNQKFNGQ